MIPNPMQGGTTPYQNPSYPMSRLTGSTYAAPLNYNQPSEVVGGYDAMITPMTGEEVAQTNFARGGGVSPAGMASFVQSRGRGDDSVLIHMAPDEVHGLQALAMAHGGSLTINPETGLYEAGFLKKLLPTIIGAGLSFIPGVNALGAGLLTGAFETARTGDLGKGLMAGLGAYSGAGLGKFLTQAGINAAAPVAEKAATSTLPPLEKMTWSNMQAPMAAAPSAASTAASTAADTGLKGLSLFKQNAMAAGQGLKNIGQPGVAKGILSSLSMPAKAGLVSTAASLATPEYKPLEEEDPTYYMSGGYTPEGGFAPGYYTKEYPGYSGLAAGGDVAKYGLGGGILKNLPQRSKETSSGIASQIPGSSVESRQKVLDAYTNPKGKKLALIPASINKAAQSKLLKEGAVRYIPGGYTAEGGFSPGKWTVGASSDLLSGRPTPAPTTPVRTPFASSAGGTYSASNEPYSGSEAEQFAAYMQNLNRAFMPASTSERATIPNNPSTPYAAGGGVTQNYVAGKLVTGAGDGMSDSIRANIDGHQEARLADGEFVIPADVVSHLGNGSTDAGSKKLYAMMDRVRKARTGRTRQAPQTNFSKIMPA